jgi:alanine-glyoxylate transaminase/serine-glyoxylate transaminase/serine-pyruvate transaminase
VRAWGLEILCLNPAEYSSSLTAILMPEGYDESELRKVVLDNFNLSLGAGLAKLAGKVFRIGHLGDLNDLMLCGTLCGVEMGLELFGVPFQKGGVAAAMDFLAGGATGRDASHVQRTAASSPEDGGDEKQRTPTLSLPV